MIRRGLWVYGAIGAAWGVVLAWQAIEHTRVREAARQTLISRARDITSTVGLVIRSQRRWGGIVSEERLESALSELIKTGELKSVVLRNTEGQTVVAAGRPMEAERVHNIPSGVTWTDTSLTLANLVDLGTSFPEEEEPRRTIVVGRADFPPPPGATNGASARPPGRPEGMIGPGTNGVPGRGMAGAGQGGRARGRPPGRPFWMSEEEYKNLIAKKGLHSFIIAMSTDSLSAAISGDLRLRWVIALLASTAAVVAAMAWRNVQHSAELELRLVKASEMNSHLKQMNLAAAGLAHETRNPLNIIRGLAQLISREPVIPPEILGRSVAIVDEADRVTAQLNEFINYSRPREVRPAPVAVAAVAGEVARALAFDAEEKKVSLRIPESEVVVEADEQLFRQALFNLMLNAIQAVDEGGEIEVVIQRMNGSGAALEVRDNGPGIPVERRSDIFRPYFTTQPKGTGLGLAVVQQIVAAHGWEIECGDNTPRGAVFRIGRMKSLSRP